MSSYNEITRRQIQVNALELGMYVCELDRPWDKTPFLFQGFPLLTLADVEAVQQICQFVYIDETRRVLISATSHARDLGKTLNEVRAARALAQEINQARDVHKSGSSLIKSVLHEIQLGRGIDTKACRDYVRQCVDSLLRNESAMIWLSRIKQADEYTGQHCLAVSVLAIGFARFLGHNDNELEQAGLCGLLHDVGKIKVDQLILNKPGKLTEQEFKYMREHAKLGYDLLLSHPDVPPNVVDAAYNHHERLDGAGYPRALNADQIPYWARVVSICDVYDAITSHRVYDGARPPKDAIKVLMSGRETQFDDKLVLKFVEWIGAFPVGTLVSLHTGEIAIIVESERQQRLRPRVVVLRDENKLPCKPRYMDLSRVCVDSHGQPYRLRDSLADGSFGVSLNDPAVQSLLNADQLAAFEQAS